MGSHHTGDLLMALDLFPSRIRFVDTEGRLTAEAVRALNTVFDRIGGASGTSTSDLAITDDDDSGLEEFKSEFGKSLQGVDSTSGSRLDDFTSETAKAFDALNVSPISQAHVQIEQLLSELNGLRDVVAELAKRVSGIEQGTTP